MQPQPRPRDREHHDPEPEYSQRQPANAITELDWSMTDHTLDADTLGRLDALNYLIALINGDDVAARAATDRYESATLLRYVTINTIQVFMLASGCHCLQDALAEYQYRLLNGFGDEGE